MNILKALCKVITLAMFVFLTTSPRCSALATNITNNEACVRLGNANWKYDEREVWNQICSNVGSIGASTTRTGSKQLVMGREFLKEILVDGQRSKFMAQDRIYIVNVVFPEGIDLSNVSVEQSVFS